MNRSCALACSRALAALAMLALASCDRLPARPARVRAEQSRGVIFADWTANGYAGPPSGQALDAIAATGARVLPVVLTAYQPGPGASAIEIDPLRTPSAGAVRALAVAALARGLSPVFKPHVDLVDGAWRGGIEPRDPAAWVASYPGVL